MPQFPTQARDFSLLQSVHIGSVANQASYLKRITASVVYWSEFLATDTEVPGSIPGYQIF